MNFDTYFCFSFLPNITELTFLQFSFSYFSLISYLGARKIKLSIIERYCHAEVSNFADCGILADCWCSYLLQFVHFYHMYSYRLEKIKITAERVWKFLGSIVRNDVIMTNGIRKVRQGVNIFYKIILDSCKIHLRQILVHGTDILNWRLSNGFGYLITACGRRYLAA